MVTEVFQRPNPKRTVIPPRYIGFRTYRYGPEVTRVFGASKGAGVPLPKSTNWPTHQSVKAPPMMMNTRPKK